MEQMASRYLGVIHAGFGFLILVGGAVRFPPPTYRPLLDATNGHVWPYSVLFLASALPLLFARTWFPRVVGCGIGVLANSTFSALFLVALLTFSDAAATAWWAYFAFATLSATLGGLIVCHRPRRDRRGK